MGCGKYLEVSFSDQVLCPDLTVTGNFYSIHNDYEKPARIFFSQGNEVEAEEEVQ